MTTALTVAGIVAWMMSGPLIAVVVCRVIENRDKQKPQVIHVVSEPPELDDQLALVRAVLQQDCRTRRGAGRVVQGDGGTDDEILPPVVSS